MKIMFYVQGAGELSLTEPFIEYALEKGDDVITFIDVDTIQRGIVNPDQYVRWDVREFNFRTDAMHVLANNIALRRPDVLFLNPSRGWHTSIPEHIVAPVKVKVALEANLQFRGVGHSYILDGLSPSWLDYYFYAGDKAFFNESMNLHYGTNKLPKSIENKVFAEGFIGKKLNRKKGDYVLVYLGGGLTKNDGLLQQVVDNLPKEQKILAISNDMLVGNYPNVQKLVAIEDFDSALGNCQYFIGHEALGTVNKCMVNGIPFVSIRGEGKIKEAECDGLNKLGYGRVITHSQITAENLIEPKAPKAQESGVVSVYSIIENSLV